MNMVLFRKDLEAFRCESCKSEIFHACSINKKFYCYKCFQNVEEIECDSESSDTDGLLEPSGKNRIGEQPGIQHGEQPVGVRELQPTL